MARPRHYDDPAEFDAKVDQYVLEAREAGDPLTMTGLAIALGFVDKSSIYQYQENPKFLHSVKRARQLVQHSTEMWAIRERSPGAIFSLKHNYGWRDKHEIDHNVKSNPTEVAVRFVDDD